MFSHVGRRMVTQQRDHATLVTDAVPREPVAARRLAEGPPPGWQQTEPASRPDLRSQHYDERTREKRQGRGRGVSRALLGPPASRARVTIPPCASVPTGGARPYGVGAPAPGAPRPCPALVKCGVWSMKYAATGAVRARRGSGGVRVLGRLEQFTLDCSECVRGGQSGPVAEFASRACRPGRAPVFARMAASAALRAGARPGLHNWATGPSCPPRRPSTFRAAGRTARRARGYTQT